MNHSNVDCQLIYGDGGETGPEDLWKFHSIALFPFMLGLSPENVSLFLYRGFVGLSDDDAALELLRNPRIIGEMKQSLLPDGYNDYFMLVYKKARGIDGRTLAELDRSAMRIISGRGFFDFENGGFIRCGKEKFYFRELRKSCATTLNILDICNSPHAVAVFNDTYPSGDPSGFKWKRVFRNPDAINIPLACDRSPSTWAFRIGYEEQPGDDNDTDHWIRMSPPIGDAVTSCVLLAIKSLCESNFQGPTLGKLFVSHYSSLRTGYLAAGICTPKGFADLRLLETLIRENTIKIDLSKYDCEFFQRQGKWFLTHERVTVLGDSDGELANVIIDHVVRFVKQWHEEHPDSLRNVNEQSRYAWNTLLKTLGQCRHQLKSLELDYTDDSRQKLVLSDEGILFEAFAISCCEMGTCVQQVLTYIETGRFTSEDASDEFSD